MKKGNYVQEKETGFIGEVVSVNDLGGGRINYEFKMEHWGTQYCDQPERFYKKISAIRYYFTLIFKRLKKLYERKDQ